ncbi:MAG TPA: metallophosphoesterase family protein [Longimicrobiales bacterium]|nr:metallophosphoesterase family protein [Longimicrobiales bacterium]
MANPAADASTGVTIGWHARVPGTYVQIAGEEDRSFRRPRRAEGRCEPVRHHDTATDITYDELRCVARLSGLEPGTAYRYRAGRTGFSPVNRFRTAAEEEPFSFLYMSDVHVHNPIPGRLGAAVASLETARALAGEVHFTVFGGDMLAYGSAWDAWQSLTDSPLVRTQMTAFTPGNHEFYDNTATSRGPGYFNAFVYNPDNGAEGVENTSYHFRAGDVLFLSISSEDSWSSAELLESQKRWFREVVEASDAGVVVAFTHRPFYNGSTGNAGHARTNRDNWSALFDELGVDLVLSGHDHVYVRTAPTYAGERSADPDRGTVYVGSTAVGDRYREADPENPYTNIERIIGGARTLGTIVTVEGGSVRLRTYDLSGAIVDEAVLR